MLRLRTFAVCLLAAAGGCAGSRAVQSQLPWPHQAAAAVPPAVRQLATESTRHSTVVSAAQARLSHLPAAANSPPTLLAAATLQRLPPPEDTLAESGPAIQPAAFTRTPPVSDAEPEPLPLVTADYGRRTMPVDFATALGMTSGQNPRVAFAQAQVQQAFAQNSASRVLWLPSIRAGMNYNKHEGRIQEVVGNNIEVSRGAAYGGLGAAAVGAGSPAIPGIYAQFHLADAIHQPHIAGSALDARQAQGAAVNNDQLLETALAYLTLLEAHQRQAIALETVGHGRQLAEITGNFARAGAGTAADADRAAAAVGLLENEATRADEAIAVASARLAQQLSADPSVLLTPQEPAVVPIDLVRLDVAAGDLVATGLANRPELAASRSLVCEAVNRLRREEHAPWLPSIVLGVSYGGFGAGIGGRIDNGGDRFDFDGVAYWELRNLGFGERAARDNASAQIQQARMREVELLDQVAREVVEAQVQVQSRRRMIATAEKAIQSAENSYRRNLERIRNAQGLPIEVLQSIQALDQARREYLRSVVEYNQAQFRLHRSLGWPLSAL